MRNDVNLTKPQKISLANREARAVNAMRKDVEAYSNYYQQVSAVAVSNPQSIPFVQSLRLTDEMLCCVQDNKAISLKSVKTNADLCVAVLAESGEEELPEHLKSKVRNSLVLSKETHEKIDEMAISGEVCELVNSIKLIESSKH